MCNGEASSAACSGWVYGLVVADSMIQAGTAERVLVLGAEKLVLLTNTPGVLDKAGNLLTGLTPRDIDDMLFYGVFGVILGTGVGVRGTAVELTLSNGQMLRLGALSGPSVVEPAPAQDPAVAAAPQDPTPAPAAGPPETVQAASGVSVVEPSRNNTLRVRHGIKIGRAHV